MILAHIIQPTRGNSNSETPIDNIFASILSLNFIVVDSTATISDHIPQFTSTTSILSNLSENICEKNLHNFEQEN